MLRSLFLLLLLALPLSAQEVDVSGNGRIPVRVLPFSGGGEADSATRVVVADLNRTLLIEAGTAANPNARATASAVWSNGTLTGQLTQGSASLFSRVYTGQSRRAAHEFADDVLFALTKVKGFSSSRVACISAQGGSKEVYVTDIDGAGAVQLTGDRTISAHPKWNPDGKEIAYTSYKSGYPDVYVIHLSTSVRSKVSSFPGINTGPAFSPDGSHLALTLSKDGNPLIYVIPSGGGSARRLTQGPGTETSPSWSPDGSKIVYDSDERGSVQLYIALRRRRGDAPLHGGLRQLLRGGAGLVAGRQQDRLHRAQRRAVPGGGL